MTREVELDDPVGEAVHRPHMLVRAHQHAVRGNAGHSSRNLPFTSNTWMRRFPRSETKTRGGAADRYAVRRVELTGSRPSAPPFQERLSRLVEFHDARVSVAVRHEERAVRQPVDHRRTTEAREVVVLAEFIQHAERLHELLAVVREPVDDVPHVINNPDMPDPDRTG